MPGIPSADRPVPHPNELITAHSAPEKNTQQRTPISERAKSLVKSFTGWIKRRKPNPDAALQEIAAFPVQGPKQEIQQDEAVEKVKEDNSAESGSAINDHAQDSDEVSSTNEPASTKPEDKTNGTGEVIQNQPYDEEKRSEFVKKVYALNPPITFEQDIEMGNYIAQNSEALKQIVDSYPPYLEYFAKAIAIGYLQTRTAAFTFIESNLPLIESKIQGDNFRYIGESLDAISKLVASGYPDKRQLAMETLGRHVDDIRDGLNRMPDDFPSSTDAVGYIHALEDLVHYSNPVIAQEADKILSDVIKVRDGKGTTALAELLASRYPALQVRARGLVITEFNEYGLDFFDLYKAWGVADIPSAADRTTAGNFEHIRYLESRRPGITKFLIKEYGIKNFHRYPRYMLLNQYEQHQDTTTPYGVILYPRNDYNGAFSVHAGTLNIFESQLRKLGAKYNIRIIEAESKMEIARSLIRLNQRYGQSQKISFAIIGGHGTKDSIQFGGTDERHLLYAKDLLGKGAQRASEFFSPNPTVLLVSCSTGIQEGIGQQLSKTLGAKVIAPDVPTNIKEIKVDLVDGALVLDADYNNEESGRSYVGGQIQEVKT